ncbi:hypothetical protein [Staphylococcus chromogenes]|nr:hypothetical protein [Staphylococcus chromogenes]HDF3152219.1 hypothetical protein [Staphylococcus aureus]
MNKQELITLIDVMEGLTESERKRLEKMEMRKLEMKYLLLLTEKTDEMLN